MTPRPPSPDPGARLPCPFCGGEALATQDPKTRIVKVGCDNECFGARAVTFYNVEDAIEAYNQRPPQEASK